MEVQLKRPTPGNASPAPLNSQDFGGGKFDLQNNQTMMMSCKDVKGKSLTVVGNKVGFAATDLTDTKQQWMKVLDSVRKAAFAIVNLATGQAIQIPTAANMPVRLVTYKANDTSQLWTAEDAESCYCIIREFVNTNLVLDAVHKGLQVVASNYTGVNSQLWMIELDEQKCKT